MTSEWTEVELADLISVKHGYAFKGEYFSDAPTGYQLVTPGNFAIGGGFQFGKGKFYKGPVPEDFILREGDVVVTMTDLSKAADTLGYSAKIPETQGTTWLHNQRVGLVEIRPGVEICLDFLQYVMRSRDYRHWVLAGATGSTVKHTAPSRLCSYRFKLPPPTQQVAIAEILTTLDERVNLLREINVTLESIAQALFKSWFIDFAPVRAKMQGCAPEGMDEATAALFPDGFEESELGEMPRGWTVSSILDNATLLSGGTPKTSRPDYWGGEIAWASAKDVSQSSSSVLIGTERTITHKGLQESAARLIPPFATVVVARGATTGRMVLLGDEMAMNQTCYALTSKIGTPIALYCQMRREIGVLVNSAHGSVFDTITTSTFSQSKTVQPSTPLLERFEAIVRPMFQRIVEGTKTQNTLVSLRDILLPRLISGEIHLPEVKEAIELVCEK